jgi:hypothetical protein
MTDIMLEIGVIASVFVHHLLHELVDVLFSFSEVVA